MVARRIPTTALAALRTPASRFMAQRVAKAVFILLLASGAIFAFGELLPGDVCSVPWNIDVPVGTYERCLDLKQELGMNRPAPERYFSWLGGVFRGDFGFSLTLGRPVWEVVDGRVWLSTVLLAFAFLWAVPTGMAASAWAGKRPKSIANRLLGAVDLLARSVPEFFTGLVLIVVFALTWEFLPASSAIYRGESPLTQPEILVLPGLTMGFWIFAHTFRSARAGAMERGGTLPATVNALPGIAWWVLGSLFVIEFIFAYPGVGTLLLFAVSRHDAQLLQAVVFFFVLAYVLVHLAADLLAAALQRRLPGPDQPPSRLTPLPAPPPSRLTPLPAPPPSRLTPLPAP